MWVCVVAVFSVIGFAWFRTTSSQLVALINPAQTKQSADLLVKQDQTKNQSPFATILSSTKGLWANISELFDFSGKTNDIQIENQVQTTRLPSVEPNLLPLSHGK